GPPVPRRDRETDIERYARLMLILFKPWTHPAELADGGDTWSERFNSYQARFTHDALQVMDNLQLLHECRDSRDD
ncbi:hypothetical protein FKP32DRAFT_1527735, partial [Trametes sanguinea]